MLRITRPQGILHGCHMHLAPDSLGLLQSLNLLYCLLGLGVCTCCFLPATLFSLFFPWLTSHHLQVLFLNALVPETSLTLQRKEGPLLEGLGDAQASPLFSHHVCNVLCIICLSCHTISSTKVGLVGGLERHTVFQMGQSSS